MKKVLIFACLFSISLAISASLFIENKRTVIPNSREYLDLSKDPVDPNGISAAEETQLVGAGWIRASLKEDFFAEVQFKDANGVFYRKQGWLRAGTILYYNPNQQNTDGGILLKYCKNVEYDWRVLQYIWQ
ncbi:MAG TPA: hypothetical protein PK239_18640 [Chitinophagales bacterium]|nr:hypothetical protein [Chitinophagales bacterium]HRK29301.1 hypothetical protein [Chitinophagales bacterium]